MSKVIKFNCEGCGKRISRRYKKVKDNKLSPCRHCGRKVSKLKAQKYIIAREL